MFYSFIGESIKFNAMILKLWALNANVPFMTNHHISGIMLHDGELVERQQRKS
jgi:hypothetical protein